MVFKNNLKIIVFGVFDGLHPGHMYFFESARKLGLLTVVVARNKSVKILKNKLPKYDEKSRVSELKKLKIAEKVLLGDQREGSWAILKKVKPDIIALGYDQKELAEELKAFIKKSKSPIRLVKIKSHHPKKFHSKIINKIK